MSSAIQIDCCIFLYIGKVYEVLKVETNKGLPLFFLFFNFPPAIFFCIPVDDYYNW